MDGDLISQTAAAAILKVHPKTLQDWRNKGSGPPWQRVDGSTAIVYSRNVVERYKEVKEQECRK